MKLTQETFLIVSKCEQLIAKGTPRQRFICHIDENDNKRFLTYSSAGRAKSAYENSGFYLSDMTKQYIINQYPHLVVGRDFFGWDHVEEIFEVKEFVVEYKEVQ